MKTKVKLIISSLIVYGLLSGEVMADEVILKNGDHLTGEVITMEAHKLILKTSYASEIFIDWSEVEKIEVDNPVEVLLKNDVSLSGMIKTAEDGRSTITNDKTGDRVEVNLAEVEHIFSQPGGPSKTKYTAQANIGITLEEGNTEKEKLHFDGSLTARKQRHRFSVEFEYDYETDNNKKTKNKFLASSNYDHFFIYPWYVYGKGSYEFDEFKDLDLSLDIGPGIGYQFVEGEITNLALEGGPSYVRQDFKKEARRNYIAARSAIRANRWFLNQFFQLFLFAEGFVNPKDVNDRFARARTGLRFPLGLGFSLSTKYNLDYDGNPPEGIDDIDQTFLFLLGYDK